MQQHSMLPPMILRHVMEAGLQEALGDRAYLVMLICTVIGSDVQVSSRLRIQTSSAGREMSPDYVHLGRFYDFPLPSTGI